LPSDDLSFLFLELKIGIQVTAALVNIHANFRFFPTFFVFESGARARQTDCRQTDRRTYGKSR